MSICLLPTSTVFPRIHFCGDLFDEFDHIEKALQPLSSLVPSKHYREFDHIEKALQPLSSLVPSKHYRRETVEKVTDDELKLTFTLDVSQFKPEELKINLDGRTLTIEGKQEAKDEQSYSVRSFVRRWMLPENVDIEKVHSSMTSEKTLVIEAPKIVKHPETTRSISIMKAQEEKEPVNSD